LPEVGSPTLMNDASPVTHSSFIGFIGKRRHDRDRCPATRVDTVLSILAGLDLDLQVTARGRKSGIEGLIG
jgi:hypothetical protein